MSTGQSASHFSSKFVRSTARWLCGACLLALVCVVNHSAQDRVVDAANQEGCSDDSCKRLAHLTWQGKSACACAPVDFKKLANLPQAIERANVVPQGAYNTLHSRPGATKVIYLDFDGHVTQNTPWNDAAKPVITTTAYDIDGNPASFNATEQANITELWERVAECFSPFEIDVTTEAPSVDDLINTGGGDTKWGIRVLHGDSEPSPAPGAGGVAFLTVFGAVNWGTAPDDIPCWVFQDGVGTSPKFNADAAIHEVGHTLGLAHDGLTSPATTYYSGHGTGNVAWAPHMGVGYSVPLVQWSKGEYANANNQQDDLAIITNAQNGFGYRVDDFASTQSSAKNIPGTAGATNFNVNVSGVIERTSDSDWFKILCGSGTLRLDAVGGPSNTMIDIELTLYNSTGGVVVTANPATDTIASINQSIQGGTYYLKVDGVGLGDPLATGYTDYSSLGQYTITGSFSTKGIKGAPVVKGPSTLFYGVKQQPVPVNTVLTVTDPDNTSLESATVKLTTNFISNQDRLSFTPNASTMGNIVGSYNTTTGVMSLTSAGATATVGNFQNALRAVCYSNISSAPSAKERSVEYQVYDGAITSNILTSKVTIGYFYVLVTYDSLSKTLTIEADPALNALSNSNSIAITQRAGLLVVEGAGATRIGNATSSVQSKTFPYTGDVKIIANMLGGNDNLSLVSVKSSTSTLNLGDGNDTVTLTYSNITSNLIVNGGAGLDTVKLVGSIVATKAYTSVP